MKNDPPQTGGQDSPEATQALRSAIYEYVSGQLGQIKTVEVDIDRIVELSTTVLDELAFLNTQKSRWLYFRLASESLSSPYIIPRQVGPVLSDLQQRRLIDGWWWLHKADSDGAGLRIRVDSPVSHRDRVTQELTTAWNTFGLRSNLVYYEPELRLFGGTSGVELAHRLFCADSDFVFKWTTLYTPVRSLIPTGISVAVVFLLLRAAGLDLFECWDVFEQIRELRKPTRDVPVAVEREFQRIATSVIGAPQESLMGIGDPAGKLLRDYGETVQRLATELQHSYFSGELQCGRRQFLVAVILFHWNRAGLTPITQSGLARAIADHLFSSINKKTA